VWHGKLAEASAKADVPIIASGPSAQPGINSSLRRTVIALTFLFLVFICRLLDIACWILLVGYKNKKGRNPWEDVRPWGLAIG
jgi:hypothetical protein